MYTPKTVFSATIVPKIVCKNLFFSNYVKSEPSNFGDPHSLFSQPPYPDSMGPQFLQSSFQPSQSINQSISINQDMYGRTSAAMAQFSGPQWGFKGDNFFPFQPTGYAGPCSTISGHVIVWDGRLVFFYFRWRGVLECYLLLRFLDVFWLYVVTASRNYCTISLLARVEIGRGRGIRTPPLLIPSRFNFFLFLGGTQTLPLPSHLFFLLRVVRQSKTEIWRFLRPAELASPIFTCFSPSLRSAISG